MKFQSILIWSSFFIASCKSVYTYDQNPKVSSVDYSSSKPDSILTSIINPYKTRVDAEMNTVIGYLGEDMEKGYPEGKLGNFAADVFYLRAKMEMSLNEENSFCLINNGGLRVSLQKGEITKGKIFELLPFENTISVIEIKGAELIKGLPKYLLSKKGQPLSANAHIEIKSGTLSKFELNWQSVDSTKIYFVVTNDYLANGGDNLEFLKNNLSRKDYSEIKLRDCMIEFFQKKSTLENPIMGELFGRVIIE